MNLLGRHLRRLVPAPVAAADLALFRRVATFHLAGLDAVLPRLSRTANHSVLWLATAGLLAGMGGRFGRRAAMRGVFALSATSAVANLPAKLIAARLRPDIDVVPQARRLARIPTSTSFPSGHSASAAAFATAVGLELPRARVPIGVLAAGVAFSRVYTGVHYPGDVAAGAALGVGIALATRRVWPLAHGGRARGAVEGRAELPSPDGAGLVIVANAEAGPALLPGPAERLRSELPAARIVEVGDPDQLDDTLEEAVGTARALGIAGGDGSVSVAATVARRSGLPLLIVPAGTLNHLAADLGLHDVDEAIRALRGGEVVAMDVSEIDGRPYVNAASIGMYPHLVDAREELEQRLGKWPAFVAGLVRTLVGTRPAEVELDGRRQRLWMLFAGNCTFAAPGITPTWRSRLDDGCLDVRVVRADRPWSRARALGSALIGRLERSATYEQHRVRQVHVRSLDGALRAAADGETFTASQEFTIRKLPDRLRLLVPPQAGADVRR